MFSVALSLRSGEAPAEVEERGCKRVERAFVELFSDFLDGDCSDNDSLGSDLLGSGPLASGV